MRAVIKGLYSPDISVPLDAWLPDPGYERDFGFLLQLLVGPADTSGEESFDLIVCTPEWLRHTHSSEDILVGRHYLFVFEYDWARIGDFLTGYVEGCTGSAWQEVALKLSRLGHWEFEDYRPDQKKSP